MKNDGSLVSIGDRVTQTSQIDSGVKNIFPGEIPTLLMEDGSLYSLYEGSYSLLDNWIDSPSSSERNFVGLANPYTNDVLSFNAKDKGNIDGTLNDDVLSGTTRNDVIDGKYGTDTVWAKHHCMYVENHHGVKHFETWPGVLMNPFDRYKIEMAT